MPASTAARELRAAFLDGYRAVYDTDAQIPLPADGRLVRLAAAISRHAAVSGRGELHNRSMPPAAAVRVALTGLAQSERLSPSQVRSRVTARFPELDRVPLRPHLDTLIAQTGLDLEWTAMPTASGFPNRPAPPPCTPTHRPRCRAPVASMQRRCNGRTTARRCDAASTSMDSSRSVCPFRRIGPASTSGWRANSPLPTTVRCST
ncbi:serine/threonine kinase domain protein [Mycobacterium xenopi 3993]|nr:serine/threonine kinase domain protein [Mycobacterium xenopi 3993]